MNNGTLTPTVVRADPAHAKLLRNIERFTQLIFEAFENEQSCTLVFHMQKGRPAGFKVTIDEPPAQ